MLSDSAAFVDYTNSRQPARPGGKGRTALVLCDADRGINDVRSQDIPARDSEDAALDRLQDRVDVAVSAAPVVGRLRSAHRHREQGPLPFEHVRPDSPNGSPPLANPHRYGESGAFLGHGACLARQGESS